MSSVILKLLLIAVTVSAKPSREHNPPRLLENCRDIAGNPYYGYFPNYINCNNFFFCYPIGPGLLAATQMTCANYRDEYGREYQLRWNFLECACDYPWNIRCYNLDYDYFYRFRCALPLNGLASSGLPLPAGAGSIYSSSLKLNTSAGIKYNRLNDITVAADVKELKAYN